MPTSLHFDNTDCASEDYGVIVTDPGVPEMPASRVDTQSVEGDGGGVTDGSWDESRIITPSIEVHGTSPANLRARLDNLWYLLRTEQGEKSLRFDAIPGRFWKARLFGGETNVEKLGISGRRMTLNFSAADPWGYSTTAKAIQKTMSEDPDTFIVEVSGTAVGGTVPALPVWIITNTTGGNISSVQLNNTTTEESITITKTIANNAKVKIDRPRWVVEYSNDGGSTYTKIMDRKNASGMFPTLDPRVENTIVVTGCDPGTLDITYRERYK